VWGGNLDGGKGVSGVEGRNREKRSRLLRHVLKRQSSAGAATAAEASDGERTARSGAENISGRAGRGVPPRAVALPCPRITAGVEAAGGRSSSQPPATGRRWDPV